jgi:uncharacterized sulfatase
MFAAETPRTQRRWPELSALFDVFFACFAFPLLLLFFFLTVATPSYADDSLPNVLLIISDDQGWTDYGFMQHPHIQTPHLDQLARESLTFTRGYVPSSLCRPSLASIVTGRYPHEHGIVGNDPPVRGADMPASRDEYLQHIDGADTLPELLATRGYTRLQTGKWWEGSYERGGFDHGMTHGDPRRGGRHGDDGLVIGREGLAPIFDFIREAKSNHQPFLVWYAPMMPHTPHDPPERLLHKYRDKTDSIHIARYWAMCQWFDETCGQLLTFLDEQQLREKTIVIYVTDNGWINRLDSAQFAAKSKLSPYDGGVRTPIMVRWPHRLAPKRDDQTLVSSLDIVPTVLRAAGVESIEDLPGVDLLNEQQLSSRHAIFGEIFEHDVQDIANPLASLQYRWMIEGNWKIIVPQSSRVPAGVELYDLYDDPQESKNLAKQYPDRVADLVEKLSAYWPAAAKANE